MNLFLDQQDTRRDSRQRLEQDLYRRAWSTGLKTTYYLRTLQASNIEKSTVAKKTYHRRRKSRLLY